MHLGASCLNKTPIFAPWGLLFKHGKSYITQPNLYAVPKVLVFKIQNDWSTRTKVIPQKPLSLQTDDRDKPITCKYDHKIYAVVFHVVIFQRYGCHPGKSLDRFLGSLASWINKLTCPDTLSWTPSSIPWSFCSNLSKTLSANLLTLSFLSPKRRKKTFDKFFIAMKTGY